MNSRSRKGGGSAAGASYVKAGKLDEQPHQRGGNRRKRTARTDQVDGYVGKDRGFIRRGVKSGTVGRQTRHGNRGSIAARNWLATSGQRELEAAADRLSVIIDQELAKIMAENSK